MGATMLNRIGRLGLALLAAMLGLVVVPSTAASASGGGVFAGACVVTLTLTAPGGVGLVPGPASMHLEGGGTCVINGAVKPINVSSPLASLPTGFGCVAGAASGNAVIWSDDFLNSATIAVVNTGGVISIAFDGGIYVIAGAAALVQDPLKTAACIQGTPITSTTWTGALVIEDPTLPDAPQ